jgi:hypothetical protein
MNNFSLAFLVFEDGYQGRGHYKNDGPEEQESGEGYQLITFQSDEEHIAQEVS